MRRCGPLLAILCVGGGARGALPPEVAALRQEIHRQRDRGALSRAAALAEQALARGRALLPAGSVELVPLLGDEAEACEALGRYRCAGERLEEAMAVMHRVRVTEPAAAAALPDLPQRLFRATAAYGRVRTLRGDWPTAESFLRRAHGWQLWNLRADHPDLAQTLHDLGALRRATGQGDLAESYLHHALALREGTLGPGHPKVAETLTQLGEILLDRGEEGQALPLLLRARSQAQAALGEGHPGLAPVLAALGDLERRRGAFESAGALLGRALALDEAALGPDHPVTARVRARLGLLEAAKGPGAAGLALQLLDAALRAEWRALDDGLLTADPTLGRTEGQLGRLRLRQGDLEQADRLLRAARRHLAAVPGSERLELLPVLRDQLALALRRGQVPAALDLGEELITLGEAELQRLATWLPEDRLAALLGALRPDEDVLYSLAARGDRRAAVEAAALAILRKGRLLDEAATAEGRLGALVRRMARAAPGAIWQELLQKEEQLAALRQRYARQLLSAKTGASAAEREQDPAALRGEITALQQELATQASTLGLRGRLDVDAALPLIFSRIGAGAALLEILAYRRHDPAAPPGAAVFGEERYLGLVLLPDAERPTLGQVEARDLGPRAEIDGALSRLLAGVRRPGGAYLPAAQELDRRIVGPLEPLLSGRKRLLVAPDGALHLLPFAVLWDGARHLDERYELSYLTAGRSLLSYTRRGVSSRGGPVVLAHPDYGAAEAAGGAAMARGLGPRSFRPLPGTAEEAAALQGILPEARLLLGRAASKGALLGLSGPLLLHVATHGLLLGEGEGGGGRGVQLAGEEGTAPLPREPLLRSALVLAGAQGPASTVRAEGLATALELSGLDLLGTQLVVLSACDTGRGELRTGQGVYGLRRALELAGAETLVASLWQVDNRATRDLMVAYYQRLRAGADRAAAMHEAARELRRRLPHPYYWAPFVVVGRGGPLRW